jgi:hypothetical protein
MVFCQYDLPETPEYKVELSQVVVDENIQADRFWRKHDFCECETPGCLQRMRSATDSLPSMWELKKHKIARACLEAATLP